MGPCRVEEHFKRSRKLANKQMKHKVFQLSQFCPHWPNRLSYLIGVLCGPLAAISINLFQYLLILLFCTVNIPSMGFSFKSCSACCGITGSRDFNGARNCPNFLILHVFSKNLPILLKRKIQVETCYSLYNAVSVWSQNQHYTRAPCI